MKEIAIHCSIVEQLATLDTSVWFPYMIPIMEDLTPNI